MSIAEIQETLFTLLKEKGADLVGAGDVTGVVTDGLTVGVSMAIAIPPAMVETLKTAPTKEYCELYADYNKRLDAMAEAGAEFLWQSGFRAKALSTKNIRYNREDFMTELPHKTVATRAGLGWIGKSCLLITPEFGGAVRISSILTDAPLKTAAPIDESRCGKCHRCADLCPGQAIYGTLWKAGTPREKIFDLKKCIGSMNESIRPYTEHFLCGRCFAVCAYTQGYLRRAAAS